MGTNLSSFQQRALQAAVRGKWLYYYEIFPHWVHRQEWTAERLVELGYLERRNDLSAWAYQYRVVEEK